jgi:hypothetical protein
MGDESGKTKGEGGGRRVAGDLPTGSEPLTLATNHLDGFRTDPTEPKRRQPSIYLRLTRPSRWFLRIRRPITNLCRRRPRISTSFQGPYQLQDNRHGLSNVKYCRFEQGDVEGRRGEYWRPLSDGVLPCTRLLTIRVQQLPGASS